MDTSKMRMKTPESSKFKGKALLKDKKCVVTGGALGIGVGDRLAIMEYAYYSVISPEGCAAILWKDGAEAPKAAEALKLTSKDLMKLGVVDHIIDEPLGGAHRNPHEAIHNLETYLIKTVRDLRRFKIENLIENRYRKIRRIGEFIYEEKPVFRTIRAGTARETKSKPAGRRKAVKS